MILSPTIVSLNIYKFFIVLPKLCFRKKFPGKILTFLLEQTLEHVTTLKFNVNRSSIIPRDLKRR